MANSDQGLMNRRRLLQGALLTGGLGLLGGCATAVGPSTRAATVTAAAPFRPPFGPVAPILASTDRIFDITVCLRPFRAAGPRLDVEQVGDALIVHNYGHGGSGWSLSWGSSVLAVRKAMANSPAEVAVLGCGALGLTSAILAQRAGAQVTIYAKEFMPNTRSARATGTWSPDSRIALASAAAPGFGDLWEEMARTSFKTYRQYLGLPGNPVEWTDHFRIHDDAGAVPSAPAGGPETLDFVEYYPRIRDLTPPPELVRPGSTPFDAPRVLWNPSLTFNIADYGHTLLTDFLLAGGKLERREFHGPSELAALRQKVVINCPGYGARSLWNDRSITPVRGQIAWLIPQPEVKYGLYYKDVIVLARTDGIVVQSNEGGDMRGYGDDNETPDRAEAEHVVGVISDLYARFGAHNSARAA